MLFTGIRKLALTISFSFSFLRATFFFEFCMFCFSQCLNACDMNVCMHVYMYFHKLCSYCLLKDTEQIQKHGVLIGKKKEQTVLKTILLFNFIKNI